MELSGEGNDTVKSTIAYTLGDNLENLDTARRGEYQRHRQRSRQQHHRQQRRQSPRRRRGRRYDGRRLWQRHLRRRQQRRHNLPGDQAASIPWRPTSPTICRATRHREPRSTEHRRQRDIDGIGNIATNKIVGNDGNNRSSAITATIRLPEARATTRSSRIGGLGGGVDVMTGGAGDDFYETRPDHRPSTRSSKALAPPASATPSGSSPPRAAMSWAPISKTSSWRMTGR